MMQSMATVYIPFAPYHERLVARAMASVSAQTVKCDVLSGLSVPSPSIFRNVARFAKTPFVIFLDADDLLDKRFVEACIGAYETGRYVYTSWYDAGVIRKPKECAWSAESHHIVTTLYPTAIFKALGGFDEQLPGHEDADFYMRSYARGICGKHLDEPLVIRPDDSGLRSKTFHQRADYKSILASVAEKNGGMSKIMGCCGMPGQPAQTDPGAKQEGDILAETLWDGTRTEWSPYSQRKYLGGNHVKIFVAPIDLEKFPHLYRAAEDLSQLAPLRARVLKESGLIE